MKIHRIGALTAGGDAHNVFDVVPTNVPALRKLYSPAWDPHLSVWAPGVKKRAVADAERIRTLAVQGEHRPQLPGARVRGRGSAGLARPGWPCGRIAACPPAPLSTGPSP
jgi:hypothetical protein